MTMTLRIQEIREQRGISRAEMARAAEVTWAAAYKWETGKAMPTIDKAARVAKALGCKMEDLIEKEAG